MAAYFIAEKRGFEPGHELDDWLAAAAEIDNVEVRRAAAHPIEPGGERIMKIGEYCKRAVVAIASKADAADAAKLMRAEHVGFLIVYREGDELQKPSAC